MQISSAHSNNPVSKLHLAHITIPNNSITKEHTRGQFLKSGPGGRKCNNLVTIVTELKDSCSIVVEQGHEKTQDLTI